MLSIIATDICRSTPVVPKQARANLCLCKHRYWGHDEKAVILHFHGPKPGLCLECLCTHSMSETSEACQLEACKGLSWPSFYMSFTVDEGSYFKSILILFYRYLADSLSMQYGIGIDRTETVVG